MVDHSLLKVSESRIKHNRLLSRDRSKKVIPTKTTSMKIITVIALTFTFALTALGLRGESGTSKSVLTPVNIPLLSSSQTRADVLQEVHHLNISFGGAAIDWDKTTTIKKEIPKPINGKRSIDDISRLVVGTKLEVYTFDPNEYLWMYVNCWGDHSSLSGFVAFRLEQTADGDYQIPDYVRQVTLDINDGPTLNFGEDTVSARVLVRNEWGGYQDFWVPIYDGMARIDLSLLDQEGLLVRTVRVGTGESAHYENVATDLQTGENVEVVHSSTEIQKVSLKGWLKLNALEMNVLIDDLDWWGFGTIINIETPKVALSGFYTVKMRAEGVRHDYWGDEIKVSESPEFVTVRSLDTNDLDMVVGPGPDGTFQVRFVSGRRYQIIPGAWPTLRERPLPREIANGKG